MREINAIKVDGELLAVGMRNTLGFNHNRIAEIKEYSFNDPRNEFNFIGYFGLDENEEIIFDVQTNSAIVFYGSSREESE